MLGIGVVEDGGGDDESEEGDVGVAQRGCEGGVCCCGKDVGSDSRDKALAGTMMPDEARWGAIGRGSETVAMVTAVAEDRKRGERIS